MARRRYRTREAPLPPPLPPETRTVGQLVAETIRLYGARFTAVLPLGVPVVVLDQISLGHRFRTQTLILWACSPLLTASYVAACRIAAARPLGRRDAVRAFAVGLVVFAPVPLLAGLFVLPALAWLALFGLAVPAAALEGHPPRAALTRGRELGQADYVHALGSLATLVIVYGLTRFMLFLLLQTQGDAEVRIAVALADLVLSPLLFLGAALLYVDQDARRRLRPAASHGRAPVG
jgi:hypothetical protein